MRLDKKILLIDTGWLRAKHKVIEDRYPKDNWIRAVAIPTHLELNDKSKPNEEDARNKIWNKYVNLELCTLLQPGFLLASEHNLVHENDLEKFPLVPDFAERIIREVASGQVIDHFDKYQENINRDINFQMFAENNTWDGIFIRQGSKIDELSLDHILLYLKVLVDTNTPIWIEIARKNHNVTEYIKKVGGYKEFGIEFPATFAAVVFELFIHNLRRPMDATKGFSIIFEGTQIRITKSFITDIKIAYPALPYIDLFITSDKNQYDLLRHLYPQFAEKLIYEQN